MTIHDPMFSTEQDGNKKEYMPEAVQDEGYLAEQMGYTSHKN
jgi:hypothetical protein